MKKYRRLIERLEARIKCGTEGGVVFEQPDGSYLYKGKRLKELPHGNFLIIPPFPEEARTVEGWETWARGRYVDHRERIEKEYGPVLAVSEKSGKSEVHKMSRVKGEKAASENG